MTRLDKAIEDLFTNSEGDAADRLVLAQGKGNGCCVKYRDLGGRNRQSVKQVLLSHFPELAAPERK